MKRLFFLTILIFSTLILHSQDKTFRGNVIVEGDITAEGTFQGTFPDSIRDGDFGGVDKVSLVDSSGTAAGTYLTGSDAALKAPLANPSFTGIVTGVDAEYVEVKELGTATYDDLQAWMNTTQSSGKISGGAFTANGDSTITVTAGTGIIRATNSDIAEALQFNWAENDTLVLTDANTNYIYVDYNGGSPIVKATTDKTDADNRSKILLGKVYRDGTDMHLLEAGMIITEPAKKILTYLNAMNGEVVRATGLVTTETGNLNVAISLGTGFAGLTPISFTAFTTVASDSFYYWYNDGSWQDGHDTVIDVTNYNDYGVGLDGLDNNNHYGCHFVYVHFDGDIHVVYGIDSYSTLSAAELAPTPANLPDIVNDFSIYVGKIIVNKLTTSSFDEVKYPWTSSTTTGLTGDHGSLSGLDDDDHPLYATDIDLATNTAAIAVNKLIENTPKTYYISSNGSDSNNGTLDAPWFTIAKVNSSMGSFTGRDRVAFQCGGIYNDAQLSITSDSLTITSYGDGNKPVLSGLQTLSNPVDEGGGVYSYSTATKVLQVFQDGEWLYPSRWPDSRDTVRMGPIADATNTMFTDIINLDSIDAGALLYLKVTDWDLAILDITEYTNTAGRDTIKHENLSITASTNYGYYLTGITSEIDDGEWSYNTNTDKVYVDLFRGDTEAEITVTSLDTVVLINADNITIENVEIRGSKSAGLKFADSGNSYENIVINNVDFIRNHTLGIQNTDQTVTNLVIKNCSFKYNGGHAMRLFGTVNTRIYDNSFYAIGTDCRHGDIYNDYGVGANSDAIYAGSNDGLWIEDNTFEKVAYQGVHLHYSAYKGRKVANNYLRETMLACSDGGAIYISAVGNGDSINYDTIINNTIVSTLGSLKMMTSTRRTALDDVAWAYGVYQDEAQAPLGSLAQNTLIHDNIIDSSFCGIFIHKAKEIDVIGNVIRNGTYGIMASGDVDDIDSITLKHNRIETLSSYYPFYWINGESADITLPIVSDFNVVMTAPAATYQGIRYFRLQHTGSDTHYNLFEWREHNNDTLDKNSVVYESTVEGDEYITNEALNARMHEISIDISPELHTSANAASDPNGNEADTITGWSEYGLNGTGANVFESQSDSLTTGTYAFHINANDTPISAASIRYDLDALGFTTGDVVRVSFDVKHVGTGDGWNASLSPTTLGSGDHGKHMEIIATTDITWNTVVFECIYKTYSTNGEIKYLVFREGGDNNNGGIYVDNLLIKKIW